VQNKATSDVNTCRSFTNYAADVRLAVCRKGKCENPEGCNTSNWFIQLVCQPGKNYQKIAKITA